MKAISILIIGLLAMTLPASGQTGESAGTVTGTVVSSTSDNLVIRTATGEMTFTMSAGMERPASMPAGTRVTVFYHPAAPGTGGQPMAMKITAAETGAGAPGTSPETEAAAPGTATPTPETGETETAPGATEELPSTASPLPVLALLGLASLATSLGLRRWRAHQRSGS